jgi:tetratricopeptide (TPR) repeat protein
VNRKNRKPDPVTLAVKLHDQAIAQNRKGKLVRARELCLRSIKLLECGLGPEHPDVANVVHTLGTTYERQERYSDAERLYLRALRTAERAARAPDVDSFHAQVLDSLAGLYRVQGRYTDAEPLYQRAIALAEEALGPADIQLSQLLNNLAVLYKYTARFGEASELYQRALSITTKALGRNHPEVAAIYHNLGGLEHARGQFAQGEPFARRSVRIRERALGANHPDVAADVAALAALLDGQQKYSEAERLYQRALAIAERAYGRNHLDVAVTLNNLAALYQAQGIAGKSEPLYRRALAIKEKVLGPDHPDVAMTLNNLGVFYKALGKIAAARPCYERALAIFDKALGASHPKVATALLNYADLLEAEAAQIKARARRIETDLKVTTAPDAVVPTINPRYARFRLVVRPSRIHRWGVFALQSIPSGVQVIEYTGERISRREGKRRSERDLHYLFTIDSYWSLDGFVGGSGAEYINHSCDPSLFAQVRRGRVFYLSQRRIRPGEELSIDYRFSASEERVPCHCGAKNCASWIGGASVS